MLELRHGGGKSLSLSNPVLTPLQERLRKTQGFGDYKRIQSWLKTTYDQDIPYKTLWCIVHNRFQARSKIVLRPQSQTRNESTVADFEKKSLAIKY